MTLRTDEERLRQATENVMGDFHAEKVEQQARAIAIYYQKDEETWRDYLPVLIASEAGRLKAVYLDRLKPENIEGFRNYMANR